MASAYDILNMSPDQFAAALDELGLPGDQRGQLEREYFERRQLLSMPEGPAEGRRVSEFLPVSGPEGMSIAEALMSGEWDFAVPGAVRGLQEAARSTVNTGAAMVRGDPVTRQQLEESATILGGFGLRPRPMGAGEAPAPAPEPAPPARVEDWPADWDVDPPAEPDPFRNIREPLLDVEDIDWDAEPPGAPLPLQPQAGAPDPFRNVMRANEFEPDMFDGVQAEPDFQPLDNYDEIPQHLIDAMNADLLDREYGREILPEFNTRPLVQQGEGLASLYSPTRRAVDLLDRPEYADLDSLRVQLLNRGAKPDEVARIMPDALQARVSEGALSRERLAQIADQKASSILVSTRTPRDAGADRRFLSDTFFLRGAREVEANVFEVPVERAPDAAFEHFAPSSQLTAPLLHTRFAMMRSPGSVGNDTYHLGEIQSDWAQFRQKLFPDSESVEKARNEVLEAEKKIFETRKAFSAALEGDGDREASKKRYFEAMEDYGFVRDRFEERAAITDSYGTRDDFDAQYPAPYVSTTSKWVQLALRQSLIDAVNRGARRMTLSTGKQVHGYTGGKLEGQTKFYDGTVPKELDEVLRKLAKEAGIKKPELVEGFVEGRHTDGQPTPVRALEFTDEFIDAIKRLGMPAFAEGGIVKGSSLDFDLLEPRY